jgi:DNA-binding LacI/PurR family transcriptional regulator
MTVRRAVQQLIDQGVLIKHPNRRPLISQQIQGQVNNARQIALLGTSFPTPLMERWHKDIEKAAARKGWKVRVVSYHHADDPIIFDTLNAFDGVFVFAGSELFPLWAERFAEASKPLIVLDRDLSNDNLVSLCLAPQFMQVGILLEHLQSLGHHAVDCLTVQPHTSDLLRGIDQWRLFNTTQGKKGQLIDMPVQSGESPTPNAWLAMQQRLKAGLGDTTALLCMTFPAAVVAMRVLHEHGLKVGKDISVCCCNSWADLAEHMVPSITHTHANDAGIYLDACMDWIERGGKWEGPLLVQQNQVHLFEGESTCLREGK